MSIARELFDTHCHIFERGFEGPGGVRLPGRGEELATYEAWRSRAGIARSLVVGYDDDSYAGNSDYIHGLATTRDWITPLRYAPVGEQVSPFASAYPGGTDGAERLAATLLGQARAEAGPRIVSLNATPQAIAVLTPAIRQLERTWFLISHLGLPGPVSDVSQARDTLGAVLGLAGCANVSVKISGQYAATAGGYPHADVQPLVDVLAETMGIGALVWGSDFSPSLDFITADQTIDCVLPTGVTHQERHSIYFQNAHEKFEQFGGNHA